MVNKLKFTCLLIKKFTILKIYNLLLIAVSKVKKKKFGTNEASKGSKTSTARKGEGL